MNDLENIPAAACPRCGGWTAMGGCSQYSKSTIRILGRTGCVCAGGNPPPTADIPALTKAANRGERGATGKLCAALNERDAKRCRFYAACGNMAVARCYHTGLKKVVPVCDNCGNSNEYLVNAACAPR